jgi:uncharacterized surface protein with fasciclin (FAS1) repeats
MKRNRIRTAAVIAAVAATAATVAPATAAEQQRAGERSLATVLAGDGNRFDRSWNDFDVAHRAVTTILEAKPGSDVAVLADGSTPLTAFLPTDRAFRRLVFQLTGDRPAKEKGTFNRLAQAVPLDTLETVLLYHVVPGATVTYTQAEGANGASLDTAAGPALRVKVKGHAVRLEDADRDDRNPTVIRKASDINEGNKQIAHGIDRVLRPIDLP